MELKEAHKCPLYHKCGGCQLQNLSYPEQLRWKERRVFSLLGHFCKPNPILGMDFPYHYRNKVQAAFTTDRKGQIISGVYQSSTHRVVPVESCLTEDETADRIMGTIRKLLKSFKLSTFDERTGRGFLRHVLIKRGFSTNQVMVVLVAANPIFPEKKFVKALRTEHPEITTVILNLNKRHTSLVLGEREKILWGPGYIEDDLCSCRFRISSKSFYQINPLQTEVLYRTAMDFAHLTGTETVIDAYCGIGTIGLVASKKAKKVIGIEINPAAVKDAIRNAKLNKAKNAQFFTGDAGDFMVELAADKEQIDTVFLDPPRAGSSEPFLASLNRLNPKRVVYISCNPETQARDFHYLVKLGWKVKALQPVDMFPHTNHIETVALLMKAETEK
ncbi:MAG: 23S rRNA (uracil(1939)-C(5))-methyltransferase RlmD [Clostridiales bacterium]|jgi:23S rRNA (uracil1939-C5)-methyltransferase|nr:23S rRNA (uracil(1939)-C(5))-methyltransferase RlmD [Clostridiales bacterium]MCI1962144.1 23S rRNA (uracil(1939)-C(5))-methyltransferase RlmD [Clostridiales bacterium]MCI2022586.1 23S rRNA (uracil(1939)-C(5))-methyltransferase RlmD [Clostridiales bacterium]MCI2027099.1 23S rRNA (uracil(1939)-C(5))-methyltransferase RlmD [Clostridiales bacterium]